MEQPDSRIHDKELAHRLALTEEPFRELARQAIQEGFPTEWSEAASKSADEASDKELERYYDEVELQRRIAEIKELSDTPTVSATKSELAAFGVEMGYRPPVVRKVFNGFIHGIGVFRRYGLDNAFDVNAQAIRINDQIVAVLPEVFGDARVPVRFVQEYYAAHGGGVSDDLEG